MRFERVIALGGEHVNVRVKGNKVKKSPEIISLVLTCCCCDEKGNAHLHGGEPIILEYPVSVPVKEVTAAFDPDKHFGKEVKKAAEQAIRNHKAQVSIDAWFEKHQVEV